MHENDFAGGVMTEGGRLPSWRDVMRPHPDVAERRYKTAEFALNLAQAARGEGPLEYSDPKEFFERTYITRGIKDLLIHALRRVSGAEGEPVIQLKTAFGGGKTHSMLALFHLLSGKVPAHELFGVDALLQEAGVAPPAKVHAAVLVGTALNPAKSRKPPELPGVTVNTLWGEMAAQLAISAGRPELYDFVREADANGVSPGDEALRRLIDECGPCLILMDEVLVYAKKLYGAKGLPAGSYDNFIAFVQELTGAVAASKSGLLAASLPAAEIEIGGEAGKRALDVMEHTFLRIAFVWKPVEASEGFEVVRRRLFSDCKDARKRDEVCSAFSRMYRSSPNDFPRFAREADYKERLISCYPIHPEVFDHLYGEWSTLERFQRTRGVLRLMAAVIHELWMRGDAAPMIMPGSIPLNVPDVKDELMYCMPEEDQWNAIVDKEIDGENSMPYRMDKATPRFGEVMAARRVARAIMLGSAPSKGKQAMRGIEAERIRLSVMQPNESVSIFNDALSELKSNLSYLYTGADGDHCWYDTRPTLRKIAEDMAKGFDDKDIDAKIQETLHGWQKGNFAGIHACPSSSFDVPDEQRARLVILNPHSAHSQSLDDSKSPAVAACADILEKHGSKPRDNKNMLTFLAPDQDGINRLKEDARNLEAWSSILNDSEGLNLDKTQEKEAIKNIQEHKNLVEKDFKKAYCWLIFPYTDLAKDKSAIVWIKEKIEDDSSTVIAAAYNELAQGAGKKKDALVPFYAPEPLLQELNRELQPATDEAAAKTLWDGDSIEIGKLWGYFCAYCYMPRLCDYSVLERCIRDGIAKGDFAYAEGKNDGRFTGLKIKAADVAISKGGLLVKREAALRQLGGERKPTTGTTTGNGQGGGEQKGGGQEGEGKRVDPPPPVPPKPVPNTSFHLSKDLDYVHIYTDVRKLMEEVISHIANVKNSKVNITLIVEASLPDGTPSDIVSDVKENCRTLGVDDFGFNGQV